MRGVAYDAVLRAKLMALHEQGVSLQRLSQAHSIARPVLSRWWARYCERDLEGLQPLSRRPHQSPTRLPEAAELQILRWRRRGWGAARIAAQLQLGKGSVQRVLERAGENRLPRPQRAPVQRYEKQRPGELLHLDIKFLPALRNARYDYEFAAVDDYSREAVAWITTEQTSLHATQFLEMVVSRLPYRIEAVMTDNGLAFSMKHAFHSDRLTRFQQACRSLGIEHKLLRPYRPECNGKVERFFRTVDDECLNLQPLFTPKARSRALEEFVWFYNHQRPHLSLRGKTPFQRRVEYFFASGCPADA
jgi:transposase InsO family protein